MEPNAEILSAIAGIMAIAPELVPANARELIASAMTANRRPARRAVPQAIGGFNCAANGSGLSYDTGPIRVICIDGAVNLNESPLDFLFGGVGSLALAAEIRASADSSCAAILFDVNCPGGSVAGMSDIEAAVRYAKTKKPIHAIARDLAASGGYWAICLANEIVATPSSMVGSVGALMGPLIDPSKALEQAGITTFVARTGENKGAGMPGVPLNDSIKTQLQTMVDTLAAPFFAAVAEGRGVSPEHVRGLQAGVYAGADAKTAKLVDRIVPSFDQYVAELQSKYAKAQAAGLNVKATARLNPAAKESLAMAIDWSTATEEDIQAMPPEVQQKVKATFPDAKPEEPVATVAQLKEAFPTADAFRLKALEGGMTLNAARAAFVADQATALASVQAENATLKAAVQSKADTTVKVLGTLGASGIAAGGLQPMGEAPAELTANAYDAAIYAEMKASGVPHAKATATVNQKHPELRRAWLTSQVATSGKRSK